MIDYPRDMDHCLLDLKTTSGNISWALRNAIEGVQIFGGIGSGKTSGSGRMLALKYLANGFGGLVLTAKHDEAETWEGYCAQTGRTKDLIIVDPQHQNYFDFIGYESQPRGNKTPLTQNIVQVIKTVIRARDEKQKGKSDDGFWEAALDMLISNTINLCQLAYEQVSIQMIYDIAQTALRKNDPIPLSPQEKQKKRQEEEKERLRRGLTASEPQEPQKPPPPPTAFQKAYDMAMLRVSNLVSQWKNGLSKEWLQKNVKNDSEFTVLAAAAIPQVRDLKFVRNFFTDTYKNISEKTRSIIDFSLMGFLYNLLQEPIYSMFCANGFNFTPEDCLEGKIIIINLPVKDYFKAGQDAQIMFKYIWQRAMERRRISENNRPVFLWADEAQHFLHEHDADFQATARSSMVATVYLSQNLPNYFGSMGGDNSESKVKSFLGTLNTKIFHANSDVNTNEYASSLIGQEYRDDVSRSVSMAAEYSSSKSVSIRLEPMVRPEEFSKLKTGGKLNSHKSEAFIHVQGKIMTDKNNFMKVSFDQNYLKSK